VDIAALIVWVITAVGGFGLLTTWVVKGGLRPSPAGGSRFPPGLIFGHFLLAAAGLVLWIIYVETDTKAVAWIAFVLLLVIAGMGFTMFARWLPSYRAGSETAADGTASGTRTGLAERHFPVPVVAAHGLLAATTLVLVLLSALGVGD
jgi:hypothetical protein